MLRMGFGVGLVDAAMVGFTAEDISTGTLVLNFVNRPPLSLSMDMTISYYSQWANDTTSSLSGLVGYYQVKG